MTDLELMKRAAKAAGMVVHRGSGWQSDKLFMPTVGDGTVTGVQWDPLDDDGDALRLAVKCNISIIRLDDGKADAVWNDAQNSLHIESSADDYAATRRAIVRAAAATVAGACRWAATRCLSGATGAKARLIPSCLSAAPAPVAMTNTRTTTMNAETLKDPAKRAEWVYGQPMAPCPACGSYNMKPQMPIAMETTGDETVPQLVGKWARATKAGATPLQGPAYYACWDCFHKGPAVDCTGRTSEACRADRALNAEMKRLWNAQTPNVELTGLSPKEQR